MLGWTWYFHSIYLEKSNLFAFESIFKFETLSGIMAIGLDGMVLGESL